MILTGCGVRYESEQRRALPNNAPPDAQEAAQFQQLLEDIAEMESKHSRLVEAMKAAQTDALQYLSAAHGTFDRALGGSHPTVVEIGRAVYELAVQYEDEAICHEYQKFRPSVEATR